MYVYPKKHKSEVKNEPAMVSLARANIVQQSSVVAPVQQSDTSTHPILANLIHRSDQSTRKPQTHHFFWNHEYETDTCFFTNLFITSWSTTSWRTDKTAIDLWIRQVIENQFDDVWYGLYLQ